MEYDGLRLERDGAIARIVLDRPKAMNTLNEAVSLAFLDAVIRVSEDPSARVLVITGEGNVFSAGADVQVFMERLDELPLIIKQLTTYVHGAIAKLARMRKPTIAAVPGIAAGGGMGIAIACDMVIAAESARFRVAYPRIGLNPDAGTSYFLPRVVGVKRAISLAYLNPIISSSEALELGIASEVVPDSALKSRVDELAKMLAEGSPTALGKTKKLMTESFHNTPQIRMTVEFGIFTTNEGQR
jgi:2-(1,2-epoxy-1,2-dihydrophenyl)acetyl-CoA isomerase